MIGTVLIVAFGGNKVGSGIIMVVLHGSGNSNPFIKACLAHVDKQIAEISAEIDRLIHSRDTLAHSMKILCSIPGIGAATILIKMPEIGKLDLKQVASLTGLAPMARQSGQWRGKSFIQGGQ